jgi:type I site-specific restriction-modification system R (restriction) subunit
MVDISEKSLEQTIEATLLAGGPDAYPGGEGLAVEPLDRYENAPGGYRRRRPEDYNKELCLDPGMAIDFILATQPKIWERLEQHHGSEVKERFLKRLSGEIERRGTLDVLRNGIKDSGCSFKLAYFRPASGLNEDLQRLHAANLFTAVRQLRYSQKTEQSLDLVLFLNSIPIFTAELKNPLNGQNVEDAVRQYKKTRDPREPVFSYGRCLAHFAVDPDRVFVTTQLLGEKSWFLPFNQGRFGGAGNPPVPPTQTGYATRYLWERVWARDSVLDLIRQFIHEVEEEDEKGRKTGRKSLIFPRYHQLDAVRRMVRDARSRGAGQCCLIRHSAGSGKSFTIAWLAHQLSVLHDPDERRVFDSIVVITDRRVLDRQLQRTVRQFEQILGVVENIDTTSRQLKEALESGKTIIVTTLLREKNYPWKTLVAFSGTVRDRGMDYTEPNMNGFSEKQTAKVFERPDYRFLIVANKFQTGFDQPLLHTMYVDKKLGGVNAVQTLSRLDRTHPEKTETMVLDFANDAEEIRKAFEPYYETTILSEATDPNLLYEIQNRLKGFEVFVDDDVKAFAKVYFDPKASQDQIYAVLEPARQRFDELLEDEKIDFRGQLKDYVRLYAFLSQILTFADADLEKLYQFSRYLRRLLPVDPDELPREVQQKIDMESYRIQQTSSGPIKLERQAGQLQPQKSKEHYEPGAEELEPLSQIVAELNERFGLHLGEEHRATLGQMMTKLDEDVALDASARVNTRENGRLTFDQKVEDVIQEIVDSNFDLYKRITDDRVFGESIKNLLFDIYLRSHRQAAELLKQHESKTLEFKSTLRWNLKENRKDPAVTNAVIKTIAAFLNTEGGDVLIGVSDDRSVRGIEVDAFENEDKFMLHLSQVVQNALGDRAGTCVDPRMQIVKGKSVCVVTCQRSPEPVFMKTKEIAEGEKGDFYVRSGPGSVRLAPDSAEEYIQTRFASFLKTSDK